MAFILCLPTLTGCGDTGNEGDCATRIGFKNTIYRQHNAVDQTAPPGELLGEGDQLDCDGSTFGSPEQVYAVEDVDPALAILIKTEGHGIYVAEGLPPSSWPTNLRAPGSIVRPSHKTESAVSDFVEQLQSQYRSVIHPAVDWEENTILIGAASPVPDELQRLDGTSVAGLSVDVFAASVTISEYEAFIKTVGRTDFPGKGRVCSFSLATDSSSVAVNVVNLDDLSAAESAALQAELESLTQARLFLRQAPELTSLSGPAGSPC